MKKINHIYRILVLTGLILTAGCSDFMDTKQMGVVSMDDFYQNDKEVTDGLYAIYDKIQSQSLNTFQFTNLLSDDMLPGGASRGVNVWGEELHEFTFGSTNSIILSMFTRYYQIIYTSNLLISKVDEPNTEIEKVAIAEAKALRAYAYFDLVTLWGTVPLVTKPLEPDEYAQPNATLPELWGQIESDLKEAIAVLPLKSQQSIAKKGNVSKGTAQAWLGKAYLYQKKYDEAVAQFDAVIASGEYSLNPDFSTIALASSEFGAESLFEISYSKDLSSVTESNPIIGYCGPRATYFKAGNLKFHETSWGRCEPNQVLYDAYVKANDVVRRKATLINEQELINDYGGSYRSNGVNPFGSYGLIRMKYGGWISETPGLTYQLISGTNFRITRYADVLLMAAEAYNRKSNPDNNKALGYINQVRQRVQLPNLTSTDNQLFADIKTERQLELAFEFVRYQDLIRWGDAATVLANQGKQTPKGDGTFFTLSTAGFKSYNWLLPFPETEKMVNPNLKQNQGY